MIDNSAGDGQRATESRSVASLEIDKVRNVISQIKKHLVPLAREGVDVSSISDHIAMIEHELEKPDPKHSYIRGVLERLQVGFGKMDQTLISSGAFALLNRVLGTGVPS